MQAFLHEKKVLNFLHFKHAEDEKVFAAKQTKIMFTLFCKHEIKYKI